MKMCEYVSKNEFIENYKNGFFDENYLYAVEDVTLKVMGDEIEVTTTHDWNEYCYKDIDDFLFYLNLTQDKNKIIERCNYDNVDKVYGKVLHIVDKELDEVVLTIDGYCTDFLKAS